MRVHYLHQNMHLGQDSECAQWAQRLLEGISDRHSLWFQMDTGSRLSPNLHHSNLWRNMRVHYLHLNMHLGQDPECDHWAQRLLEIGITDGEVELPAHMHCGDDL
jgi:hypothetical protein